MEKIQGATAPFRARHPLAMALVAGVLLAASTHASAVAISSDLTITGSVELSTAIGQSPFSDGAVVQTGEIRATSAGVLATEAFSTTAGTADGADDGTTVLPTTNPLTGALTDTGDGIGWTTDLNADFETGFDFNEGFDFVMDFGIDLANTSLVDTFTVTVRVDFSQTANADGDDAFSQGGLDVEVDNVDALTSDIISDSFLGDELNGTPLGTFGAAINDVGVFDIVIVLAPGDTAFLGGTHQWEGGVFASGSSLFDTVVDISILSAVCTDGACGVTPPNPNPAPIPGTLALLGLALPGLALARRRRKAAAH